MKKRILSLLLVIAMAFCMLASSSLFAFATTNDGTVESVVIVDVTEPVPGEYPRYTYNVLGSGYKMNTAKNAYYDAYWADEKWYYIKNGIGWFDLTESDWVYEHETFIPGHEYKVYVYLVNEDGYEFAYTDKYYENATTATVNGNEAEIDIWEAYFAYQRRVGYSFGVCESVDIVIAIINDVNEPKAGETPDFDVTPAHSSYYALDPNFGTNGVVWCNSEGMALLEGDTFVEGERYTMEVKIIPVNVGGVNMCQFVNPFEAYINGKQLDESKDGNAIYAMSDCVYIYYTFESTAPAETPTQKGDVNGDGTVTATDYILAKRAVMGTYALDDAKTLSGDINGDGSITATDYILLKRAVMGTYVIV